MENSLAHRSMFSNIKNLESCVNNRKFWIPNSKRKFANAALFGCIFAPALLENLQPTNTTTPPPASQSAKFWQKCITTAKELTLFRYIQIYWISCCQCIKKADNLFTYQIVHQTHIVSTIKTNAKTRASAKTILSIFKMELNFISLREAMLKIISQEREKAEILDWGLLHRGWEQKSSFV